MKEIQEYEKDLASIRTMMERSAKFISLSGLSGVLAGIYALIGATAAYFIMGFKSPLHARGYAAYGVDRVAKLLVIAGIVLVVSVSTGLYLSYKKATKHGLTLWTSASRRLFINLMIPLVTGGLFILIILYWRNYGMVAPACLVLYGLALIQASSNTYDEIRYLGFCEIILGLICALMPGYGLQFWALGFGVLHIVYGAIMYNKYDK